LHALLLFLLLLALFLLDLLLEFALHSKPLCVLFALDHIFLVSPSDQDAALLFKFQVEAAVQDSTPGHDLREILLRRIIGRRHHLRGHTRLLIGGSLVS